MLALLLAHAAVAAPPRVRVQVPETLAMVSATSSHVRLTRPDGSEVAFHIPNGLVGFHTNLPFAADLDGDGLDTLGLLRADGAVLYGSQHGSAALPVAGHVWPDTLPVAGDFDGDGVDSLGAVDLLTGTVDVWDGLPGGAPDRTVAVPPFSWVVAVDLDGDGVDGLAAYALATGEVSVTEPLGAVPWVLSTGRADQHPSSADVDGDGADEFLLLDPIADVLRIYEASGAVVAELVAPGPWYRVLLSGRWARPIRSGEAPGPWTTATPASAGLDVALLEEAYDRAAALPRLHSLLVARRGDLVAEAYHRGFDVQTTNCVKSVSKSLLSTLVGLAVAEGSLRLDDRVVDHLPGLRQTGGRDAITVEHLATMSAGFAWDDATHLGPMVAAPDWPAYVFDRALVDPPGTTFAYSTGLTHVASAVLTAATGTETADFARTRLLEPLGIRATRWDEDPSGIDVGGAEVWLRPRDMLRYGQLYLDDGRHGGSQLLPPGWVDLTFTEHQPGYGLWWWRWTLDGAEAWAAIGHGGQLVVVVPSRELVVVATSEWSVSYAQSTQQIDALYAILDQALVPSTR